ncbi:MAG: hypothetical protein ACNYPI_00905 [Arenicellales bacterium WSBS_2016_MAG_OTU3]
MLFPPADAFAGYVQVDYYTTWRLDSRQAVCFVYSPGFFKATRIIRLCLVQ